MFPVGAENAAAADFRRICAAVRCGHGSLATVANTIWRGIEGRLFAAGEPAAAAGYIVAAIWEKLLDIMPPSPAV